MPIAFTPNYFHVLKSFAGLGSELFFPTKRRVHELNAELQKIAFNNGVHFSDAQRRKIEVYASQSAIMNRHFCELRGVKPSEEEQWSALYFAAFTTVLDDLMDSRQTTFEQTLLWASKHKQEACVFLFLYGKLEELFQVKTFKHFFDLTQQAQNESLKQTLQEPLNQNEILKISFDKGGYSTLASRAVLSHELTEAEAEAIYVLGGVYQLLNDTFDVYKDFAVEPLQTIIQVKPDFNFVRSLLKQQWDHFSKLYFKLPFGKLDLQKSYTSIAIIAARGWVACDQFSRLQGTHYTLDISAFSRKELIVDMEKPLNLWKSVVYAKKLSTYTEHV